MTLTDQELFDNYNILVRHYIKQNGGTPDVSQYIIQNDGTLTGFSFSLWNYGFSSPTNTILKSYSLSVVKTPMDGVKIPMMTTAERDGKDECGCHLIYNTTTSQLEFHNGTSWIGI